MFVFMWSCVFVSICSAAAVASEQEPNPLTPPANSDAAKSDSQKAEVPGAEKKDAAQPPQPEPASPTVEPDKKKEQVQKEDTKKPQEGNEEGKPQETTKDERKPDDARKQDEAKKEEEGKKPDETKKPDSSATGSEPHHRPAAKRSTPALPGDGPRKVVIWRGGASEPSARIVTGMTPEEAARQRQEAEQQLSSAEEYLTRLPASTPGPATDARQQETVTQIHNYIKGARAALQEGDISRGHTLAVKARLLAEDLVRH